AKQSHTPFCYTVRGKTYYPLKSAKGFREQGIASWYGLQFQGRTTASGERFDQNAMTCAHKILPMGCTIRVRNLENNRTVDLRVNDRGPFVDNRVIDVSKAAAKELQFLDTGKAKVLIEHIDQPNIERKEYYIQLGAYSSQQKANALLQKLKKQGVFARTLQKQNGFYAVQAGPLFSQEQLDTNLTFFKKDYPQAFILHQ
ncbi:MAG: septal ring lytic transglycosylase RlpA family protein, partial [Desulfovibrio sp.]|nr:septal ring lytic transglycosylase RlpA family protein [Desulfovibrio sp.]